MRRNLARPALVAAAAIASHAAALGAGFVWLDHAHLEARAAIAPAGGLLQLFTRGFAGTGFYRPLMAVSLSLDALVGGPGVFHATSLAWHAGASVATAFAAEALGLRRRAATLAGILFAVHPLSGLVADAIAFRSEAMIATFLLALVWAHLRRRPALAAAMVLAAGLTKETGLALAPLFVAALFASASSSKSAAPAASTDGAAWKRLLVAEGLGLALASALRVAYAPAFRAAHAQLTAGDAIGTRFAALAKSLALAIVPFDLGVCDAFPVTHVWQPASVAGLFAAAGLVWLAWRRRGAALLLVLALLPSMHLVPVMRWWSPHYVYVPLAFVAMLAAELAERRGGRALTACGVVAVLYGVVTLADARKYASDQALWTPEVDARATCREGQFYLGEIAREAHRWDAAARRYEAALAAHPRVLAYVDRGAALQNLGTVRLEQRRFDDARAAFVAALEGTANEEARREITHNLAALALQSGDAAEADRLLAAETARSDALPASLAVRAMALEKLGRTGEAGELRARIPR